MISHHRMLPFVPWGAAVGLGLVVVLSASADAQHAANPILGSSPSPSAGVVAVGSKAASAEQSLYLVRSTLLSLDDANRTGNYSVLRDLSAPGFQQAHSAADLALIFNDLRRAGVALTVAAITSPQMTRQPIIDAGHVLQLTGYLPTEPQSVLFDMRFQAIDGDWRLAALSVGARANVPAPVAPQNPVALPQPATQATPALPARQAGPLERRR